jgi:hypothetical protein
LRYLILNLFNLHVAQPSKFLLLCYTLLPCLYIKLNAKWQMTAGESVLCSVRLPNMLEIHVELRALFARRGYRVPSASEKHLSYVSRICEKYRNLFFPSLLHEKSSCIYSAYFHIYDFFAFLKSSQPVSYLIAYV